jgi:hypothetical protein
MVYRLEGHDAVPVDNNDRAGIDAAFAAWDSADRHVGLTDVGKRRVSTVFLIVNHGYGRTPQLFETAVFEQGELVDIVGRYSTWAQAEAGHAQVVAELRGLTAPGHD